MSIAVLIIIPVVILVFFHMKAEKEELVAKREWREDLRLYDRLSFSLDMERPYRFGKVDKVSLKWLDNEIASISELIERRRK